MAEMNRSRPEVQRMVTNGDVILVQEASRSAGSPPAGGQVAGQPRQGRVASSSGTGRPGGQARSTGQAGSARQTGSAEPAGPSVQARSQVRREGAEAASFWEEWQPGSEPVQVQSGEPWTYTPAPPGYAYEFGTGRLIRLPNQAE